MTEKMEVKQKKDEVYYKLSAENVYISLVKLFIQFIEIRTMIASMEHTSQGKIKQNRVILNSTKHKVK